jgi:TonB-dependent receptor
LSALPTAQAQDRAVGFAPGGALASELNAPIITVKGIRRSLDSSRDLKRDATGVVDGIVAEDIGKFPDANLAEAMQRISGVAIDRNAGEGSRITVRGVGPDFNLVLLNGRQMPASTISDTGPSNSRAFDFANLAAESISALEVFKTSRASAPTGGIGATINIKTARPLANPERIASLGAKLVNDQSNSRLPTSLQGNTTTPEVSGIYSDTFADRTFGIALTGSYQKRSAGYNQASVGNGWRTFKGDENNWGTIPQAGQPGSERITNRPDATDVYSVPQNINYSTNGIQRERTNGQLTLQYAPTKAITATLDYTFSENKVHTKRNDLSAWFNFGPSSSSWTDGPVAAPKVYTEIISGANADIAMGGAMFGVKTQNKSTGFNLAWKASDRLSFELDTHSSTAESGADSPYGTNAVLGTASFNRGDTTVDFTQDFPVLSIAGSTIDAAKQMVTGSSFRNSYMKASIDQTQAKGKLLFDNGHSVDFGLSLTKASNRTAYANVQSDTWGGVGTAADYPDSAFKADTVAKYFSRIDGSNNPALFNQWYTWDFETLRAAAAMASGKPELYQASNNFTTDRRTKEETTSLYGQYNLDWTFFVPMGGAFGLRYEKTDVTSSALVPTATGISWGSANELSVLFGAPGFTELKGSYKYLLPSFDVDAELTKDIKLRAGYSVTLGRPGWGDIQGGQTLNQGARVNGGTGAEGDPGLKPLKSKNFDLSGEWYYAKSSYVALGFFRKNIDNYVGTTTKNGTPFNLTTPVGGALYQEAIAKGCTGADTVCIRNYILNTYSGSKGVTKTGTDSLGNATGTIVGQPGDPIANFAITVPANQKKASLHGLEINIQHQFAGTGFGFGANYTYVTSGLKYDNALLGEQFALEGLGNSANLVGFYENDHGHVRVAYNWRGKFLTGRFDGSGTPNPVYTEPYAQMDLSFGLKLGKNLSLQAEVINANDAVQRLHGRTKEEVIAVTQTGRRYMLGARYSF